MIRISESLQLAKTKFKTRKIRNSLSAITISLGIILILSALFGIAGARSLAAKSFVDSNVNRFFVRDMGYPVGGGNFVDYKAPIIDDVNLTPVKNELADVSPENYKQSYKDFLIKNVYEEYLLTNSSVVISGTSTMNNYSYSQMVTADQTFVKDFIAKDYSFDDSYNGKIPVIVSKDQLYALEKKQQSLKAKENFETTSGLITKYIGKNIKLALSSNPVFNNDGSEKASDSNTDLTAEFIIVGVVIPQVFSFSSYDNSYIVPDWARSKNSEMKDLFKSADKHFIIEVNSKKDRDGLVKKYFETKSVMIMSSRLEIFNEPLQIIRKVSLGIGGFLLAISSLFVLSTLGKIVADSKREIGVFRAIGGQRRDIRKIFFSYTFLLVSLGFALGFVIAIIITSAASLKWGNEIFYSIAQFATSSTLAKPALVFVSIPWLEVLALYAFVLFVGFVAAFFPVFRASRLDPIKALRDE